MGFRKKGVKHFFPAPILAGEDLSIRAVGIEEWMQPCLVHRPEGTGDWLLMVFHHDVKLADGWHSPPVVMLWEPGMGHYYGNDREPWSHSWIHCCGQRVAELRKQLGLVLNRPLPLVSAHAWIHGLRNLYDELTLMHPPDPLIVHHYFEILLHELARAVGTRPRDVVPPPALMRVKQMIEADPASSCSLGELAKLAGCSAPHLCNRFKHYFGVSPME
ncbi:MAG: AraC family transcriptional regulator, partial [Lentisphaerae bacterium]